MQTSTMDNPMVARKKAGRPAKSTREDVAVKIDKGLKAKAQCVADNRDVSLAEYLSEALRPIVGKDFD
jgi:predicted HicB family RNase H-like nuclease